MLKVFFVLLIAAILYLPKTALAHSSVQIIEMTENGFEPDSVTVDENSTIIFLNKDSNPRWPASNTHPTHELYPEFDPRKEIVKGESWTFKHTKIGEWKYHDHLFPHMRGVINVEAEKGETTTNDTFIMRIKDAFANLINTIQNLFRPKNNQNQVKQVLKEDDKKFGFNFRNIKDGEDVNIYVREQLKICYQSGGRDGCYKQAADILYGQLGLVKTLALFKKNEAYPEVYARCHEVTHYLSRLEYDKQHSIAKVYAKCDSTCHGGCYHGTIEAYLKEQKNKVGYNNITGLFPRVCGKSEDYQKPIEFYECVHGMGHAAMFVTDMELKESLALCDTFSEQKYKERCYSGVFMENSSSSTSFDHGSKYIKKDDPFYPCNVLEEKHQSLCWQYQSSYFSIISNQDWKKVANLCLQIPAKYHDRCFRTIGTNQVGFTSSMITMKNDCDLMPSENFKDICISGVVSSLSYRFVGDAQKMIDFCALVDYQNKKSCFRQMGSGILDWNKNKNMAKKECQKIPDDEERKWCESVIQES